MEELTAAGALVATEVIKSLAKDMASFVKEKVSTYFIDTTNKELVDSEGAFVDYLNKVKDTYSKSKTILYKDEKKDISLFFEPPFLRKTVTYQDKDFYIPSDNIGGIINRSNHSKVLLTGIGGMGKTILLKHLCVNAIESGYKIPVFISLRWFNDIDIEKKSLEELIYDRLTIFGFALDQKYFFYSLKGNKYVFLLDGYDEISNTKRAMITHKISDFTTQYGGNSFVMTSRPVAQIYCWDEYRILELCPMNIGQVKNLIRKLDFDYITKEKFINELEQGLYEKYERFASIPLTLSILFITYVENTTIPETLQDFYEMAFDTLLYRHDQMKEGFERVLKSKLKRHEFREVFIRFCFMTYFKDIYSFSEVSLIKYISYVSHGSSMPVDVYSFKDDLVNVTCMLVREGKEYVFLHRSFQEYFAAYYVSQIADEKQRQFCKSFIESCSEKTFVNTARLSYVQTTKLSDFMNMLCSIESKRFDNIVLLPIIEKIYKTFLACGGDLITTISRFVTIWKNKYNGPHPLFYRYNGKIENRLNYGEFFILLHFKTRMKKYIEEDEIHKYMENNRDRINRELMTDFIFPDEWVEIPEPFGSGYSISEWLVRVFILIKDSLLMYESLLSSNQNQIAFEDMLLSF